MPRFDAVLFDCDGVLVDSEGITNGVLRDMLEEAGWVLTREECMRTFVGKAVKDEQALIEAHTGQPLTEDWFVRFRERRNEGLVARVQPIANAVEAVALVSQRLQGRIVKFQILHLMPPDFPLAQRCQRLLLLWRAFQAVDVHRLALLGGEPEPQGREAGGLALPQQNRQGVKKDIPERMMVIVGGPQQ